MPCIPIAILRHRVAPLLFDHVVYIHRPMTGHEGEEDAVASVVCRCVAKGRFNPGGLHELRGRARHRCAWGRTPSLSGHTTRRDTKMRIHPHRVRKRAGRGGHEKEREGVPAHPRIHTR